MKGIETRLSFLRARPVRIRVVRTRSLSLLFSCVHSCCNTRFAFHIQTAPKAVLPHSVSRLRDTHSRFSLLDSIFFGCGSAASCAPWLKNSDFLSGFWPLEDPEPVEWVWLRLRRSASARQNPAGQQGRVLHAMNDLLVRRAKRGQCAAELRLTSRNEVIGAQPQSAFP